MRKPLKILALSDMHWYTNDELNYIQCLDYDICVLLGDIQEPVIRLMKEYAGSRPVLAVAGNHDEWDTPERGGAENIHGRCVTHCGYTFAGISGSAQYKQGDCPVLSQRESLKISSTLKKSDILLSHDSMYHLFGKDDSHAGLLGIDLYNLKSRIKLNLCGHHHTPAVRKRWGTTTICVFRCAVISYPDMTVESIF